MVHRVETAVARYLDNAGSMETDVGEVDGLAYRHVHVHVAPHNFLALKGHKIIVAETDGHGRFSLHEGLYVYLEVFYTTHFGVQNY